MIVDGWIRHQLLVGVTATTEIADCSGGPGRGQTGDDHHDTPVGPHTGTTRDNHVASDGHGTDIDDPHASARVAMTTDDDASREG